MSAQASPKQEESEGTPAWVMTFADLMSLLMVFFVLLLSFSEMDLNKYKQVAGSMKEAFGVQREIKTMDMPKGTSVIAQEFSPGRPSPTPLNVIRQNSVDDTKQTLEFTDVTTKKAEGEDDTSVEDGEGGVVAPIQRPTDAQQLQQLKEMGFDDELLENYSQAVDTEPGTAADAQKLLRALEDEVRKGLIEIETEDRKILVRIREKGSFPSGSASFRVDFLPVIVKLRGELNAIEGRMRIAGHTDNVPINTARFRSNWELSASRSVTVAHELLKNAALDPRRFVVEGHSDAQPLAPNDTAANRTLNRRVELTIVQGEDLEQREVNPDSVDNTQANADLDAINTETTLIIDDETRLFVEAGGAISSGSVVTAGNKLKAIDAPERTANIDNQNIEQKILEERINKFSKKMNKEDDK